MIYHKLVKLKSLNDAFKAYNPIWTENKSNKRWTNSLSNNRNRNKNNSKKNSLLKTLNLQSLLNSKRTVQSCSSSSKRCLIKIKNNSMIRLKNKRTWMMSR